MSLKIRRGTDDERLTITPAEGELIYTTDTKELYIGDGTTVGGNVVTGYVGSSGSGGTGYTGSVGYRGSVGYTGSVGDTGYRGSVGYNGSVGDTGYKGSVGYTGSTPTGGTLTSDLNISTHSVTNGSTLIVNGSTGNITTKNVIVNSTDETIGVFNYILGAQTGGWLDIRTSKGSFDVPVTLDPGDQIGGIRFQQYDGTSFVSSSAILSIIDPTADYMAPYPASNLTILVSNNGENDWQQYKFNCDGTLSVPVLKVGEFNGSVNYPTVPSAGMIIFDSNNNHFYGYNGTIWKQLDN